MKESYNKLLKETMQQDSEGKLQQKLQKLQQASKGNPQRASERSNATSV